MNATESAARRRFDPAAARERIAAARLRLGSPLVYQLETTSTNDDALAAARAGAPHGACFVAEQQTRGRGRRGRSWHSEPGDDLTFSLLLRPSLRADRASGLSLVAGLSVRAAAASRVPGPTLVKWPNDVVAAGRKLSGVLVESQIQAGELGAVVVGIGVNVARQRFDEAQAPRATSLSLLGAVDLDREGLLADVLAELERRLGAYEIAGLRGLLDELREFDALAGRAVRVDGVDGLACGIDDSGRLLVRDATGQLQALLTGTVEIPEEP